MQSTFTKNPIWRIICYDKQRVINRFIISLSGCIEYWNQLSFGVPFTRNHANRTKIWSPSRSKIWTLKLRSNFGLVRSKINLVTRFSLLRVSLSRSVGAGRREPWERGWSKIWTARCKHRDRLNFRTAKAWLQGCVVTQLEKERKIANRSWEHDTNADGFSSRVISVLALLGNIEVRKSRVNSAKMLNGPVWTKSPSNVSTGRKFVRYRVNEALVCKTKQPTRV